MQAMRSFIPVWSEAPSPYDSLLVPLWTPRHIAAAAHTDSVRHSCAAMPVHQGTWAWERYILPEDQIQLVCMYNFVRDQRIRKESNPAGYTVPVDAFGTYLVRVMGNGLRRDVSQATHTAPFTSSSMIYDQSFNVLYVTSYESASYSGKKHILKARLNPSYNFIAELPAKSSSVSLSKALVPTSFRMPAVPASSAGSLTAQPPVDPYPAGMTFDYAAVEPLSSALFFYNPTLVDASTYLSILFYIPVDQNRGVGYVPNGERNMHPIRSEHVPDSPFAGRSLAQVSTVYKPDAGATLLFTLYAGTFVRYDWTIDLQPRFQSLMQCSQCPPSFTSDRGSNSISACYCAWETFLNSSSQECVPVTQACPYNHFISKKYDRLNDNQCQPCYSCPLGFYRKPTDCLRNVLRDPSKPAECLPCSPCPPGFYIDPAKCLSTGTRDINPSTDCLSCSVCRYMQTVVGPVCPGTTVENWQSCMDCTASCPIGTYIAWHVRRCDGFTRGSATEPFDPITECVQCDECQRCAHSYHTQDFPAW